MTCQSGSNATHTQTEALLLQVELTKQHRHLPAPSLANMLLQVCCMRNSIAGNLCCALACCSGCLTCDCLAQCLQCPFMGCLCFADLPASSVSVKCLAAGTATLAASQGGDRCHWVLSFQRDPAASGACSAHNAARAGGSHTADHGHSDHKCSPADTLARELPASYCHCLQAPLLWAQNAQL